MQIGRSIALVVVPVGGRVQTRDATVKHGDKCTLLLQVKLSFVDVWCDLVLFLLLNEVAVEGLTAGLLVKDHACVVPPVL